MVKPCLISLLALIAISCANNEKKTTAPAMRSKNEYVFALGVFHDPGVYETWKGLKFSLGIKNLSSKEQSFVYTSPHFWYPVVIEPGSAQIVGEVYNGQVIEEKVTLKPNETFWIVSSPVVELMGIDSTGFKEISAKPGIYTIQCQAHIKWQNKDTTLLSTPQKITIENKRK
jgi:hypothetical protein